MSKIIGIIQAKYFSTELMGKALQPINGVAAIEYVIKRLKRIRMLDNVVVATTSDTQDDVFEEIARRHNAGIVRGPSEDLMTRCLWAMNRYDAGIGVKVLGNAPLVDYAQTEALLKEHIENSADISYNEHYGGIITGLGAVVFSRTAIENALSKNLSESQKAGVSLYFRQHENIYNVYRKDYPVSRPNVKLLIDNASDAMLIEEIYKRHPEPLYEDILKILDASPILTDYQTLTQPREVGEEKLYLFPDKIKHFLSAEPCDYSYPVSVELSLTNRCNFDCVWCSDKDLRKRRPGDLSLQSVLLLIKNLAENGDRGVVIEGGGEPTLYADFETVVRAVKDAGLSAGLITNGSIRLKDEVAPLMDWIRVSLDASSSLEHSTYKKNGMFEQVLSNISGYVAHDTVVGIGYVVTKFNTNSIEPLVIRLKDTGVRYIHFRPVIDHPELASKESLAYLKKYEGRDFSIMTEAMTENRVRGNGGAPCVAHSLSSVITADGAVYLCGRLNIHDWIKPIGNINDRSFNDIWRGEERRRQIEMVKDPDFCLKNCPECRMTKYNILLGRIKKIRTVNFI
jgi:radical SAM protein with 4Fe4S-binding SPASM domain